MKVINKTVLIKVIESDKKTKGGIIIPDTYKNDVTEGEVILIGNEVQNVNVGDNVIFFENDCQYININDEKYVIIKEKNIKIIL